MKKANERVSELINRLVEQRSILRQLRDNQQNTIDKKIREKLQRKIDKQRKEIEKTEKELEKLQILSEVELFTEQIKNFIDIGKNVIDTNKNEFSDAVKIILNTLLDLRENIEPELDRLSLINAKALRRDYKNYREAGFTHLQTMKIIIAKIKPVSFAESLSSGLKNGSQAIKKEK